MAFVRRGCKPREAFRCGEENDATSGGAQSAEAGARATRDGRTGDDALSRRAGRRGTARADGARGWRRGRAGDSKETRAMRARSISTRGGGGRED